MHYYYVAGFPYSDSLAHHGVKGQKWGVRRYQNEDGSLTEAGMARYHTAGRIQKALNKNEREWAYAEGDSTRAARSATKSAMKLATLKNAGKQDSKRYSKIESKMIKSMTDYNAAETRKKTLESNTKRLVTKAGTLGYSTLITPKHRQTVRNGEQLVGALLLGGIGEGIREISRYGWAGTIVNANKYKVRNN